MGIISIMSGNEVIGLMSGTSLDGVDIACCHFEFKSNQWQYHIKYAETIPYSAAWLQKLSSVMNGSSISYVKTHVELGKLYGSLITEFISRYNAKPGLIASHGHTIFHQPRLGLTAQIGDGAQIAALTGIDTICDFRSKDMGLGGQGAPLVPAGERKLFSNYNFCLNLGGIANISVHSPSATVAYDVCPANMALNYLSEKLGRRFDKNGELAANGKNTTSLLNQLNSLTYYQLPYPKSLGREWFEQEFIQILDGSSITTEDKLATVCEHIGLQIGLAIGQHSFNNNDQLLVTGGGALNSYLIACIKKHISIKLVLPDEQTISFKEAMIFAFLGLLFTRNEKNVLSAVTGSSRDHIGGALYKGI